jgi:hypothetical protein
MRIFNLDKVYSAVCNSEETKNGFRHVAILHKNGFEIARAKCTYLNRTWEYYQFESVLLKLVDDFIAQCDKQKYRDVIKNFK